MRQEIYQWMKDLAFFHVLTTAILHILPDKRYEQYIRLFLGLLLYCLLFLLFLLFWNRYELLDGFQKYYGEEEQERMKTEAEGIQEAFLKKLTKVSWKNRYGMILMMPGLYTRK